MSCRKCVSQAADLDADWEGPSPADLERFGGDACSDGVACPTCGAEVYFDAPMCQACGSAIDAGTARSAATGTGFRKYAVPVGLGAALLGMLLWIF